MKASHFGKKKEPSEDWKWVDNTNTVASSSFLSNKSNKIWVSCYIIKKNGIEVIVLLHCLNYYARLSPITQE